MTTEKLVFDMDELALDIYRRRADIERIRFPSGSVAILIASHRFLCLKEIALFDAVGLDPPQL